MMLGEVTCLYFATKPVIIGSYAHTSHFFASSMMTGSVAWVKIDPALPLENDNERAKEIF